MAFKYFALTPGIEEEQSGNIENTYQFTGKGYDKDTGLYYFNARWYDPEVGRFISEDPLWGNIRDPQSLNRFAYGRNNPFRYVDPSGKMTVDEAIGDSPDDPVEDPCDTSWRDGDGDSNNDDGDKIICSTMIPNWDDYGKNKKKAIIKWLLNKIIVENLPEDKKALANLIELCGDIGDAKIGFDITFGGGLVTATYGETVVGGLAGAALITGGVSYTGLSTANAFVDATELHESGGFSAAFTEAGEILSNINIGNEDLPLTP